MQQMNEICEMALSNVIFMEGGVECRKIPGCPEYFAGSNGVIYSSKYGGLRPLKPTVRKGKAPRVLIRDINGAHVQKTIKELVTDAFNLNPNGEKRIINKDGNILNNAVYNLGCTPDIPDIFFLEDGTECRRIPGNPDYFAGSNGVIYTAKKGELHPLKTSVGQDGYLRVSIYTNGVGKSMRVNRLVAVSFHDNPENKEVVNHIDGNKRNNNAFNLEWTSLSENTQHAVRTGLMDSSKRFKEIMVTDIITGETEIFASGVQCAERFGCCKQNINLAIKNGSIVQKRYKIEFTGNGAKDTNRKESVSQWRESIPKPFWLDGKMWMDGKECKQIPGWSDYFASPDGYIISNKDKTPIVLKPSINSRGYQMVNLSKDGVTKTMTVHRLVAITFIPNPENKEVVNHIDGKKLNDAISNLEWATLSENTQHAHDTGLIPKSQCKEVRATDVTTGKSETFISLVKCAEHLGRSPVTISAAIQSGYLVRHHYKIEFTNNETSSEVMD